NTRKDLNFLPLSLPLLTPPRGFHYFLNVQDPWSVPGEPHFPVVCGVHENFSFSIKRQNRGNKTNWHAGAELHDGMTPDTYGGDQPGSDRGRNRPAPGAKLQVQPTVVL